MRHVFRPRRGLSVAVALLALAVCTTGAVAQDDDKKKEDRETEVVFLTNSDEALAERLGKGETVDLAVVRPYTVPPGLAPAGWRLSFEFRKVEGRAPPGTNYFSLRLSTGRKSPVMFGYFSEPMSRGATLRGITAKGTCEAVFRTPGEATSRTLNLTVCVARLSRYSEEDEPSAEMQFLTESDSALAKKLREAGKVAVAVIAPYKHPSATCTLSGSKKIEGRAPQGNDYFIEGIRFRPRPTPAVKGYFSEAMNGGATLRDITAKGTFEAVFSSPRLNVTEKNIALTVCVGKVSAYLPNLQLGD